MEGVGTMATVTKTPYVAADEQEREDRALSTWRISLYAAIAGLVMFIIGVGMDMLVVREGETRLFAFGISDALAAAVAGILVYRLLEYERERRERLRQKIAVIADMNHHVRNALQVISFHTYSGADKEQLEAVRDSMERIQWALKEILPKL
jgi:two-component sensor histidine kinase